MDSSHEDNTRSPLRGAGLVRDAGKSEDRNSAYGFQWKSGASLRPTARSGLNQGFPEANSPADASASASAGASASALAARLLCAPLQIQKAQAILALEEARLLAWLRDCPARDSLGFVSFADIVRELLHTPPRTAQERVAVHRVCEAAPALKCAFLEGELSFCQLLVLEPLVRRFGREDGAGESGGNDGVSLSGGDDSASLSGASDPPIHVSMNRRNDPEGHSQPTRESWDQQLLTWLRSLGRPSVAQLRRLVRERLLRCETSEVEGGHEPGTAADSEATAGSGTAAGSGPVNELSIAPADLPMAPADDDEFRTVSFEAPPVLAVAWEESLELARRMLGYNAPRYACIEAVLIEAAAPAIGQVRPLFEGKLPEKQLPEEQRPEDQQPDAESECEPDPVRMSAFALDPRAQPARERAGETLRIVCQYLDDLTELLTSGQPGSPWDAVQRIRAIQRLSRPGRVLLARLLRDLRDTRVLDPVRRAGIEEYCLRDLNLSERTARALRSEADLFEDCPELASAFAEGQLSIGHAMRIGRLAGVPVQGRLPYGSRRPSLDRFILRASQVTCRQFDRECRFLERVRTFLPHLRVMHYGPLAGRRIESDLLREIERYGWPEARVEANLEKRGLGVVDCMGPVLARKGRPHVSRDPAHNPLTMRRMEVLLDLLVTVRFEVETENPTTVSILQNEENRQTLARGETGRARGCECETDRDRCHAEQPPAEEPAAEMPAAEMPAAEMPAVEQPAVDRPAADRCDANRPQRGCDRRTLARSEWPPQPSSVRIRFSAPLPVIQHWRAAIEWVEEKCLPADKNRAPIPTWAAVALLLDGAVREWTRTDPESVPTERKVLERDEYCCGTPGCTRRQNLESHHVELKSHGGSDRLYNRRAACAGHHRLIHLGYIRVTGRAPGALHWEIGRKGNSPDSEPIWRLLGERFEDPGGGEHEG